MERQTNSVTEEMRERVLGAGQRQTAHMPDISGELVAWLQALYPPACYAPSKQTLEEHLQYAGKVDLVSYLADIHADQQDGIPAAIRALDEPSLFDPSVTAFTISREGH